MPNHLGPQRLSQLGWDLYAGVFVIVLALYTQSIARSVWEWVWAFGGFVVWHVVVGRRAIATRDARWSAAYVAGAVVVLVWGIGVQPWLAPVQAIIVPLAWWLFLPNRWAGVVSTVAVALAGGLGQAIYVVTRAAPGERSAAGAVIMVGVLPAVIIGLSVLAGNWIDAAFRWGQERMDLVDDLRQHERQRIALEREAAANEERLRLSQDVHDTIAQDVAGLRLLVERARRQAGAQPPGPLGQTLDMIASAVDTLHSESRDLIVATAPVPAGSSFAEAVERIAGRFARETDIAVETDVTEARLTREAEVVFVRCLQEGLSNVRKHAQASRVGLSVAAAGGDAVLTLTDDGVGLPAEVPRGYGLPGMAERVRQAGGGFAVSSPGPHGGVILRVRMPLPVASG